MICYFLRVMTRDAGWWLVPSLALLFGGVGCAGDGEGDGGTGGIGWTTSGGGGLGGVGGGTGAGGGSGGSGGGSWTDLCPTTFSFEPTTSLSNPRVAGQWHDFELATATELTDPDTDGVYTASVDLAPGLHAYKLVYDVDANTEWVFDPAQVRRKYIDGEENSAIKVRDCNVPELVVESSTVARLDPGQGTYQASLSFVDGFDQTGPEPSAFEASLVKDGAATALTGTELAVASDGTVTIDLAGLADGKYRLLVTAATQSGRASEPLRLVFWVEAEAFSWQDALIYMVMTDRFRDGAPGNNPGPTSGADSRADWLGGDLEGLRLAIADGTLDQLGVRAIWLTPFQTNPAGAYLAADNVTLVTGYHGYWPVKAREVDPRLGGAAALRAMVAEAHAHGIRILMDYVLNHVHEDHEYVTAHPSWFRTGCVCGTQNCDWTGHALDCMFRDYMPDIDHTVPEANAQFVADAVWWIDEFDLDGLRVDAVKHVEEVATRNLSAEVRETFEKTGLRHFLMGETAMGWNDCADPCNDENYGTIAKYVGPHGLDGQFDFVLYHGVSYRTFAYGDEGMLHADYWFQHGQSKWPEGAIMTPYIGSHDTPRFVSMADYRGQDSAHERWIVNNQWSNEAQQPSDSEPYRRMRIGMSWLLALPGAPLLYYGDEYGQWGGADPNNRYGWRPDGQLNADELATLVHIRKLGKARQQLVALRRGGYQSLGATQDTLTFARHVPNGSVAVVGLTRSYVNEPVTVDLTGLGVSGGTVLHDELGGPNVTVTGGGTATFTVPAGGAVILAP